jgi:hypothetical protein
MTSDLIACYEYAVNQDLIIDAHFIHTLHPGVIELIEFIISHPRVYASSIFSFCHKIRNEPFAKELYSRVLDMGYADYHPAEVFNVEHLSTYHASITEQQHHQFDFPIKHYYAPERKSLGRLQQIDDPELCILIEDNNYSIAPGEEKNALLTCGADMTDFECIRQKLQGNGTLDSEAMKSLLRVNHIFYVAGLLHRALQQANPTQYLFSMQFESLGLDQYHWKHDLPYKNLEIYLEGLAELQKINPALKFHGGTLAEVYFSPAKQGPEMSFI